MDFGVGRGVVQADGRLTLVETGNCQTVLILALASRSCGRAIIK